MLSFELTEEQKALVDETRRFTKEKIIPIAAECDRKHTFPNDVFKEAWEMGLVAPGIPTEYGGNGVGEVEHVLITEELAYGCTGIQTSFTANTLAATPILVAGTEAQKKKYLGMLTAEPIFAAMNGSGLCASLPGYQRQVTPERSIGLPSAQIRPMPVIGPSLKATAKLA